MLFARRDKAEATTSHEWKESASELVVKKKKFNEDGSDSDKELTFKEDSSSQESVLLDIPPYALVNPSPSIVISTDENLQEAMLAVEKSVNLEPDSSSSK